MLAAEVDQADGAYGAAEKTGAEALEFFDRVGGEAVNDRGCEDWFSIDSMLALRNGGRTDESASGMGGGFSGVDDPDLRRKGTLDERTKKRVVSAAEHENVWV